jgi:probable HAF family extracellular repeat protein
VSQGNRAAPVRPENFITIDLPNSTFTWIAGINPEGDIVGFYNSKDGKQHGFVLSDGEFISIDIPGASRYAISVSWLARDHSIVGLR